MAKEQVDSSPSPLVTHGQQKTTATPGSTGGVNSNKDTDGQTKGASELEYKKVPNDAWTEEQDKSLYRLKVEQKPWADITKEIGKDKHECTARWKEIMPDNFYDNQKKDGTKAGDQGNKQDKSKNQKRNKQDHETNARSAEPATEDLLGFAAWPGRDETKSIASDNASMKNDKGKVDGAADDSAWGNVNTIDTGGPSGWGAVDGGAGGGGGGDGWTPIDGANDSGGNWKMDAAKDENKGKEGEKRKKKGDDGRDHKENSSAPWNDRKADDNGGNTLGGAVEPTTGWGDGDWGDAENKGKHDSGGSKRSASKSSKHQGSSGACKNDGNNTGGASWLNDNQNPSATAGWGDDNNNDGTADGATGWGRVNDDGPWAGSSEGKEQGKDNGTMGQGDWGKKSSSGRNSPKASKEKERRRKKHSSHSESRSEEQPKTRHHNTGVHHSEYKVSPDDTFSQNELKLIARILQQDCSMVWERVSWRFKDKTGRALHPHVFEKKITGRVGKDRKD